MNPVNAVRQGRCSCCRLLRLHARPGEPASGVHRLHHHGRFVLMMRVASIGAWPRTRLAPITRPVRRVHHDPTQTRRPRPPVPARALEHRPHRPGMGYRALHHPTIRQRRAGGPSPARARRAPGRGSLPVGCSDALGLRSAPRASPAADLDNVQKLVREGSLPSPDIVSHSGYISGAERQNGIPSRADRRGGVGVGSVTMDEQR